jgi:hypothetical protein
LRYSFFLSPKPPQNEEEKIKKGGREILRGGRAGGKA